MEPINKFLPPRDGKNVPAPVEVYQCEICKDAGFVLKGNDLIRCRCKSVQDVTERHQRLLMSCEIPAAALTWTLENYKTPPGSRAAVVAIQGLVSGKFKYVSLVGDCGKGKTHLAIGACQKWIAQDIPAKYVYVPELLDELRASFKSESNPFEAKMEFYKNIPLLVLDDLAARGSDWAVEKLELLVNYRYMRNLPLIITANQPLESFSPRIASRMARAENSVIVSLDGCESYDSFKRRQK